MCKRYDDRFFTPAINLSVTLQLYIEASTEYTFHIRGKLMRRRKIIHFHATMDLAGRPAGKRNIIKAKAGEPPCKKG